MDVVSTFEDRPIYFKSREHTPTTATTTDVNFNSPGHRSSQDGSFIQDEDMHLILEFGQPKNTSDLNQLTCSPAAISNSWRGRNSEWATNFDVNVAELDFDDFSASRDMSTLKGARYVDDVDAGATTTTMMPSFGGYLRSKIYDLQRSKHNNVAADCNHNKINNKRLKMRNSMEISFGINGGSMFSSSGGGLLCDDDDDRRRPIDDLIDVEIDNDEALILDHRNGGALAFISTDSLDLSSLSINEENLKAVCATKKREYVLTFDKTAFESGVGVSSSINFDDNQTNFIDDNNVSFERSIYDNDDSQFYNFYHRPSEQAFTTWDRVKRSYEMGGPRPYMGSSKCTSLPNLNPSPMIPQRLFVFDGAEEKMASNNGDVENNGVVVMPMDVQEMSLSTSWNCQPQDVAANGFSLMKTFQTKCSHLYDGDKLLTVPIIQNNADVSNDSSGYVTGGTGTSSQNNIADVRKFNSSPIITSDKQQKTDADDDAKDNQNETYRPQFVLVNNDDYEYAEFFVNGHYIDVNHNEIGFVPPSTKSVQRSSPATTVWASTVSSRRPSSSTTPPLKPPRTFATLLEQNGININDYVSSDSINCRQKSSSTSSSELKDSSTQVPVYVVDQSVQTSAHDGGKLITVVTTSVRSSTTDKPSYVSRTVAVSPRTVADDVYFNGHGVEKHFQNANNKNYNMPDLSFMKFPFVLPPLNPSLSPFLLQFLGETSTLGDVLTTTSSAAASYSNNKPKLATTTNSFHLSQHNFASNLNLCTALPDPPKLLSPTTIRHDSGLGSIGAGNGPAHIQDWESLALLLPKDVVQACSFFKANSNLLRSIDKPSSTTSKQRGQSSSLFKCRGYQFAPRKSRQFSSSEPSPLKNCKNRFESIAEERAVCQQCGNDDDGDCCDLHRCRYNNCQRKLINHCCCDLSNSIHGRRRDVASLSTSSRPTWCHYQPPPTLMCRHQRHRSCCDENITERSNFCCQNGPKNVCKCHSCDDFAPICCNNSSNIVDNCRRTDDDRYHSSTTPAPFYEDPPLLLRSEFCYRPEIDLTDVQKFYSLPNFNGFSSPPREDSFCLTSKNVIDDVEFDASKACATCYRVRSPSAERSYQEFFCDCRTSDIVVETDSFHCENAFDGQTNETSFVENVEKLKDLVNHIVNCCAKVNEMFVQKSAEKEADYNEHFNGAVGALVFNSLCPAVEDLLTDGLLDGRHLWMTVQSSTTSNPTNQAICALVRTLGATEDNPRERSLQFATFVSGLLSLRLFDVWLMMVIGSESTLLENYCDSAFVRRFNYDDDVEILFEALKSLNVLPFERLELIDLAFLSSISNQNHRAVVDRPKHLKSVVSLQKELRVLFRAPVYERNQMFDEIKAFTENAHEEIFETQLDNDEEVYVTPNESQNDSKIPLKTSKFDIRSRSSSKSSSIDVESGHNSATTTPTKKSRIPLLMKAKLTSPTTAKNNLHITITNQTTQNYSKNNLTSSSSNGKHYTYDKSYVCTIDKINADQSGFLSFDAGETLILLEEYPNGYLKCDRRGVLGLVPRDKITYISFL